MKHGANDMMLGKLNTRRAEYTFRSLQYDNNLYDFSSNDYLGFARSQELRQITNTELEKHPKIRSGATGSRLLSGNSEFAEQLEEEIAGYHHAANGLIFNSGYAANSAIFSCLPQKDDTIIHDELIHASIIDGSRLSYATRLKFRHNNLEDLEKKLKKTTGICYVAVESIYSMDGDMADLAGISSLCQQYNAHLIVDEAHAFGVIGTGLVDLLGIQEAVFARIVTFGKALGLHGAIILGTDLLRDYLINFARPFIYTTALPYPQLIALKIAYKHFLSHPELQSTLKHKSSLLKANLAPKYQLHCKDNLAAIHCIFLSGNDEAIKFSRTLQREGFDVRPILSPTVPKGKERLRICVHVHNTDAEILELCHHINLLSQ
ncbi:8-amino-7-oxononanoate synthase [Pedobacter cryoconitis]|uniref:8-amino-7-oxononanoate synthase n=1 Tax=Pedobacter cryoconitis TaxID=188932 RepID=A0A7W8ZPW3_9SPHI|nr:aminotransferase class I/II-fold pyridoxal phosphate-dependent enzyme [Pedobacter cryoconitis]MBB5637805.1 8-amino-7-oxononanoate synthase [Pedobacter cryoconitis]MBB6270439.1 8-amino-7-oxononanoate synthase [Pedobacter cryoconitis]